MNVGERPLLNDGGAARCGGARAHHLIERAPDEPISGVNGRPRVCALLGALLAPDVLDATVSLLRP